MLISPTLWVLGALPIVVARVSPGRAPSHSFDAIALLQVTNKNSSRSLNAGTGGGRRDSEPRAASKEALHAAPDRHHPCDVIFFTEDMFGGDESEFFLGSFTTSEALRQGFFNDAVSSFIFRGVPKCLLTLFEHDNFQGWSGSFHPGYWNMSYARRWGFTDDAVSSFTVQLLHDAPSPATAVPGTGTATTRSISTVTPTTRTHTINFGPSVTTTTRTTTIRSATTRSATTRSATTTSRTRTSRTGTSRTRTTRTGITATTTSHTQTTRTTTRSTVTATTVSTTSRTTSVTTATTVTVTTPTATTVTRTGVTPTTTTQSSTTRTGTSTTATTPTTASTLTGSTVSLTTATPTTATHTRTSATTLGRDQSSDSFVGHAGKTSLTRTIRTNMKTTKTLTTRTSTTFTTRTFSTVTWSSITWSSITRTPITRTTSTTTITKTTQTTTVTSPTTTTKTTATTASTPTTTPLSTTGTSTTVTLTSTTATFELLGLLFRNPGFEQGSLTQLFEDSHCSIPGWVATASRMEGEARCPIFVKGGRPAQAEFGGTAAADGNYFVALPRRGSAISQIVPNHHAGVSYRLFFYVARHGTASSGATVTVVVNGQPMGEYLVDASQMRAKVVDYFPSTRKVNISFENTSPDRYSTVFIDSVQITDTLASPARCADLLYYGRVWGRESTGLNVAPYTSGSLKWIGCDGNACEPGTFFCNDLGEDIEFGTTSTKALRALLGSSIPSAGEHCATEVTPNGILNAMDRVSDAVALCHELGYSYAEIRERGPSNSCPEVHQNGRGGWTSDFLPSEGYGKSFVCMHTSTTTTTTPTSTTSSSETTTTTNSSTTITTSMTTTTTATSTLTSLTTATQTATTRTTPTQTTVTRTTNTTTTLPTTMGETSTGSTLTTLPPADAGNSTTLTTGPPRSAAAAPGKSRGARRSKRVGRKRK